MLKQALIYLGLSVLIVIFAKYASLLVIYLLTFYVYVNAKLETIFSTSELAVMIRKIIVLVAIPLLITGIPALIYKITKGGKMPYFLPATWLIWMILVFSKVLILENV